ncbi:MAG: alpha/beta fold hydrolase [Nannocystaceae bacterium]
MSTRRLAPLFAASLLVSLAACSGGAEGSATESSGSTTASTTAATETTGADTDTDTDTDGGALDYDAPGPHPVANDRFTVANGERELLVEIWYPADAAAAADAAAGRPIADFVPAGPDRDAFDALLAELSPAGMIGTRTQTASALAAAPAAGGPWPLLLFSHCHNCARFSAFTVAEHLASHGFVVVAPDHAGNTLLDGGADLSEDFLLTRVSDLQATLDAVLSDGVALPAAAASLVDPARVGVFGHSYGAATAGRLAQEDARIKAAMAIAAPIENPIFPGSKVASIAQPLLFVRAEEDNSILVIGNNLIKLNFDDANPPAWLVKVRDAGHWNFSDICGLTDDLDAGCGEGTRQTAPGETFTYLDIDVARRLAGAYVLAFFDLHLRANADAAAYLAAPEPAEWVEVEVRE